VKKILRRTSLFLIKASSAKPGPGCGRRELAADGGSWLPPPSRLSRLSLSPSWVERENVCQSSAVKRSINHIISDFFEINLKFASLKDFSKFKTINNIIKSF
jgi:hypothetical protein